MEIIVALLVWLVALAGWLLFGRGWLARRHSRERIYEAVASDEGRGRPLREAEPGWLTRWLALAGYRAAGSAGLFLGALVFGLALGLLTVYTLNASGTVAKGVKLFALIPGAIGHLFGSLVTGVPWVFCFLITVFPWLVVRDARQRRVRQIEQDLPVFLELLATLSEAGIGFDSALARVLDAEPPERVLPTEFRTFQAALLAGRPRVQCLRRLARRVDVASLTIFISALVQAEQVGSGVADVLRRQSDDLRDRRRERAIAVASSLPVKLLFPLVICFLPAIVFFALGPTIHRLSRALDPIIRTPTGR